MKTWTSITLTIPVEHVDAAIIGTEQPEGLVRVVEEVEI